MLIHATAVAAYVGEGWRAALLRGPSGSGKSDLALRMIGRGWRLVGDDYVEVWASGGAAYACGPERIAGLIEARGVGPVTVPRLALARVSLIVDCVAAPDRLPEESAEALAGIDVARLALAALESSAPDKLALALTAPRPVVALGAGASLA